MKISKITKICTRVLLLIFIGSVTLACQDKEKKDETEMDKDLTESTAEQSEKTKSAVVDITTNAMEFKTKDELPSGWHTFRYKNKSNETHFVLFEKYPEGRGLEDAQADLTGPFQEGMNAIIAGDQEAANTAFSKLPEWFQEVEFTGGVGLTSAQTTSESTIYLEPGTYLMECYVKMPNGVFHSVQGMFKEIQVTQADSSKVEVTEDYTISIDAVNGITFNEKVTPGEKIFKVEFGEQKVHENFVKHDVNLVWVDQGADMAALNSWMNWANPKGLQTPAPQGFKFLGGMQEMNAGGTGYFKADLRPGTYALVSEVPDPQSKGLLKTFTVK